MSYFSDPIQLSFIPRRMLEASWAHVYRHAGSAPGGDGRSKSVALGQGLDSVGSRVGLRLLAKRRHAYRFTALREVETSSEITGKERQLFIAPFHDRVILRALMLCLRAGVSPSPVNVAWGQFDPRWTVARLALELRTRPGHLVRLDLKRAFESVNWPEVLRSQQAQKLPNIARQGLEQVLAFYSPEGIGVPTGVPVSSLMLDIACGPLDQQLSRIGELAYRFVDDAACFGSRQPAELEQLANELLAPLGLQCNPDKTSGTGSGPVNWLGYEFSQQGDVDVAKEPTERILTRRLSPEGLEKWTDHFFLARGADRFERTLAKLTASREQGGPYKRSKEQPSIDPAAMSGDRPQVSSQHGRSSTCTWRNHHSAFRRYAPGVGGDTPAAERLAGGYGHPRRGEGKGKLRRGWLSRTSRFQGILDRVGGLTGLLELAERVVDTQAASLEEIDVLFAGASLGKLNQLARARFYWQFVLARRFSGRKFPSHMRQERLLRNAWSVLMTASTLTMTEAVRCCVADPTEEILRRLDGASASRCRRALREERLARQSGRRPTRVTEFGRFLLDTEELPPLPSPRYDRQRLASYFRVGRHSNKRRGLRAEKQVAGAYSGRQVPGSGAGAEKGDVTTVDQRIEVKFDSQRWRLPLYQVRQLVQAGLRDERVPSIVLCAESGPVFRLAPTYAEPDEVLERRVVRANARWVSLARTKYTRMFEATPDGVVVLDFRAPLGRWALRRAV